MKHHLIALPLALLAGCNLAPKYARPEAPVPKQWPTGNAYPAPDAQQLAGLRWQQLVADPRLKTLVERALSSNRDLRATMASVLSARAQYRVQRAAQLPTLDATATPSVIHGTNFGGGGGTIGGSGALPGGIGGTGTRDFYSANLGISAFEIDLFGRVRNQTRSALENYLATKEGERSARISLVAETASAYATLAADQELLRLAEDTAASAEHSFKLAQSLNKAGLTGGLAMRQAQTVLERARSDAASSRTQVAQDRNALELLTGAPVEDALLPASLEAVSSGISSVPGGLASSVLLNRPDVLQAEHRLKAANADIGAARAALFPTISLTAAVGFASSALSSLFTEDRFNASASAPIRYSIFGGGRGANVDYRKAERDRLLAQYEYAIQTSFREVSDALARAGTIGRQQEAQRALISASQGYHDLADQRYRAGIDTYQNALDAQRTLYAAQQSAIATELAAVTNRVTLYRVIGADF